MVDLPGNKEKISIVDVPKVDLLNLLICSISREQEFSKKEIIEELERRGVKRRDVDNLLKFIQRNPHPSLRDSSKVGGLRKKILESCKPRLI